MDDADRALMKAIFHYCLYECKSIAEDWKTMPMVWRPDFGVFGLSGILPPGKYAVKYSISGEDWKAPPMARFHLEADGYGGFNGVVTIIA